MSFQVSVSGATLSELKTNMSNVLALLSAEAGTAVESATDSAAKRGPGRPKKGEPAEIPTQAAATTSAEPAAAAGPTAEQMAADMGLADAPLAAPAPKITAEQVRAALQEVAKARTGDKTPADGMGRVKKIMEKIGIKQIKDIPDTLFTTVMQYAKEA